MKSLGTLLLIGVGLSAGTVACGGDEDEVSRQYFQGSESSGLGASTNQADCATCHSVDGTKAGYPGETLKDIAYRSSFKGGDAPTLRDAANACITGWMGGSALTAEDERWTSIEAYLQSISDASVTEPNTLQPEVLADVDAYEAAYQGGDAVAGEAKYGQNCAGCHDSELVVGATPAWTRAALKGVATGRIAQKVRTSGPPPSGMNDADDSTPGPMPFFEPDEVSVDDLKDIIAFVKS